VLSLPSSIRIFVARDAVDFRKAHDGLLAVVRDTFGDDPFDSSLFVFLNRRRDLLNRRRDRVKLLQWDRDGFWLHYKRLEQGTFDIAVSTEHARCEVSRAQLAMLIEGIDLKKQKIRQPLSRVPRRGEGGGQCSDERGGRSSG
jgi:transposase